MGDSAESGEESPAVKGIGGGFMAKLGLAKKTETLELATHPDYDFSAQSIVNPDLSRHSRLVPKSSVQWVSPEESVKTLVDLLRYGSAQNTGAQGFAYRPQPGAPWTWWQYSEVLAQAEIVARAIASLPGIAKGQSSFVAICLSNSPHRLVIEHALFLHKRIGVVLFEDTAPDNVFSMCRHLGVQVLFCSRLETLKEVELKVKAKASKDKAGEVQSLKHFFLISEKETSKAYPGYADLLDKGKKAGKVEGQSAATPSDLALVFYSSTTDGSPKAVALSHGNFVAAASNVATLCGLKLGPDDLCLSYLSSGHVYQKTIECMLFARGIRIAYTNATSVGSILEDMQELKPTVLPTLPQMLNLIHEKTRKENANNPIMRTLLKRYQKHKESTAKKKGQIGRNRVMDKMTGMKKLSDMLGGELRLVVTGAAAVSKEVVQFWRFMFACVVVEGYGLTETCGAVTITNEADPEGGHVGPPAPTALIRLADAPDMGISSLDGKGEILVKGPTVAKGCFIKSGELQSIVDKDGWFHTGDVGEWTSTGCLRIIDRVVNLLKLPQGCFVAPEKLEIVYQRSRWIQQIFVTADPLKSYLVAVGVLDMEMAPHNLKSDLQKEVPVVTEAEKEVVAPSVRPDICRDPEVRKAVLVELEKLGKNFGLANYEIIRGITLRPEPFTQENGLLTITGKLRRHEIRRRFAADIAAVYKERDTADASASGAPTTASTARNSTPAPPSKGRRSLV